MTYSPPRKTYRLTFDLDTDPDMAGLVIRAHSAPVGELLRFEELRTAEDAASIRDMMLIFTDRVIEWNVTDPDTGQPVPADLDGLMAQELPWAMTVMNAWVEAITQAPPPLPNGSGSGRRSLEESLPMEPMSASLESL